MTSKSLSTSCHRHWRTCSCHAQLPRQGLSTSGAGSAEALQFANDKGPAAEEGGGRPSRNTSRKLLVAQHLNVAGVSGLIRHALASSDGILAWMHSLRLTFRLVSLNWMGKCRGKCSCAACTGGRSLSELLIIQNQLIRTADCSLCYLRCIHCRPLAANLRTSCKSTWVACSALQYFTSTYRKVRAIVYFQGTADIRNPN